MADSSLAAKCVAEFIGTFLLVFTVGCNVLSSNSVWGGVSIACVLMVAIYSLGGISGANFNPAVSLALALSKSMKGEGGLEWKDAGIYMGVQVGAGVFASICYSMLFMDTFDLKPNSFAVQAGLCEVFYTFMLCFVVLNVALVDADKKYEFYGLAIGFVIVAGAYGAGAVSGGCFNPAVAIGIDSVTFFRSWSWCIWYVICEFVGAALAALAFKIVRPGIFGGGEVGDAGKLLSEFLGTFMLVLTVGLNVLGKSPAGAFSIAASLMSMIYALGSVSGANFNPAVTTALLVTKQITPADAGKYMVVQVLAGILAAFTYALIRGGETFALGPGDGFGWCQVAVAEIIFTFVLCYVVLSVAVSPTTKSIHMFGLAIGSCVTVGGNAIGAVSGGSLNPAVSFGISAAHLINGGGVVAALVYTVCEIIGGCLAAGVFMVTHAVDQSTKTADDETKTV